MSPKKLWIITILVLSISFLSSVAFASPNQNENFEIWPVDIDPPDGSVDIIVPTDENVVIRTSFRSCSRLLSSAWTIADIVNLEVDGDPIVSTRKESWQHWSKPIPVPNEDEVPCVNGSNTLWVVDWEYDLGMLDEGNYQVHYAENVKYPFTDGADYDGDGRRDFFDWHVMVDFNILLEMEGGSISGRVISEFGDPLPGLWVDACEYDTQSYCASAETNDEGYYAILLPPGEYWVQVWVEQDWIGQAYDIDPQDGEPDRVSVSVGQDTSGIDFELLAAGMISGRVISEFGDPLPGLWVDACEYDTQSYCASAETNDEGYYAILLPPGEYWVQVWVEQDWIGQAYDVDPQDGEPDRVSVSVGDDTSGIDFTLEMGGFISGHVYEANSGDPPSVIAGVHVDACSMDDTFCNGTDTNEYGEYTITGLLPDKTYRVFVWGQSGWSNELYQETIWWDQATLVSVGATGIDFTLEPGGSISGVVTDSDDNPLANIGVDIMDGGYGVCTDENGYYSIMGLPFGTYDIVAGQDFCEPHPYSEQVITGVTIDADNPDLTGYDFQLAAGGSISGMVTAGGGGLIGDNIDVSACFADDSFCGWTSVQSDGTYEITGLPAGNYRVHAYQYPEVYWIGEVYDNTQDWDAYTPVSVTAGAETFDIDFTLELGGAITGTVKDGDGNGIEGIWIVANDYAGDFFVSWAQTDASGSYRILGLPAGTYRVFINPQNGWTGDEYPLNPVTVTGGVDTYGIDFTLAQDSTISGTVTGINGDHIPERIDVAACLVDYSDICRWTTVGEYNTYTIVGLLAGEYVINVYEVEDPGGNWIGQTYPSNIILGENEDVTGIDFKLEAAGE